jgi:subtilisin family serine protease
MNPSVALQPTRMNPLDLVKLTALMVLTTGRPEIVVGLLDGPVAVDHPDLAGSNIRETRGGLRSVCTRTDSTACMHGTFVAGILCAKRGSVAPAICPGCTLLVRPIFVGTPPGSDQATNATPEELAAAIVECIDKGSRMVNLSLAPAQLSTGGKQELVEALNYAAKRGVVVVAAAGNQGTLGSSAITRHPWVIPAVAYDLRGRPTNGSNLGSSIGKRGLGAPGEGITSLGANGQLLTSGGTSAAAAFVTGAIALLWSEFPTASAAQIKLAVTQAIATRRTTVIPPLLNAWAAYQTMVAACMKR